MPASRVTAIALSFLLLASCASLNYPVNTQLPVGHDAALSSIPDVGGDTAIALSFSGGGTRAAAFAFGVLRGLDQVPTTGGRSYLDRVAFVSGVSGGSVTAAYFGLKGRAALADFRERFLTQNAEESLSTGHVLINLAERLGGGVNDASRFPVWLFSNLFGAATMSDLIQSSSAIVWINASVMFNRTSFVFSQV